MGLARYLTEHTATYAFLITVDEIIRFGTQSFYLDVAAVLHAKRVRTLFLKNQGTTPVTIDGVYEITPGEAITLGEDENKSYIGDPEAAKNPLFDDQVGAIALAFSGTGTQSLAVIVEYEQKINQIP